MRVAKQTNAAAALMLACLTAGCTSPTERADRYGAIRQTTLKAPPIPKAGALAQPKSPRQIGLPDGAVSRGDSARQSADSEKIALGQKLFFDGRLSADGTVACGTCHDPARAFTDGRPVSVGIHGRAGQRNAPTILNALFNKTQFWDGRVNTLEEQARCRSSIQLRWANPAWTLPWPGSPPSVDTDAPSAASSASPPNGPDLLRAIASYERTQLAFDSPFDHYIAGEKPPSMPQQRADGLSFNTRGPMQQMPRVDRRQAGYLELYGQCLPQYRHRHRPAQCRCAGAPGRAAHQVGGFGGHRQCRHSDGDVGTGPLSSFRRRKRTLQAFKTPNLRNVLVTGPYFHDGSQETLWDVVDHYNKGDGLHNPYLDEDIQPLALKEPDIDDLVAFLASLTSSNYKELGIKELARQRALLADHASPARYRKGFRPETPRPNPNPP